MLLTKVTDRKYPKIPYGINWFISEADNAHAVCQLALGLRVRFRKFPFNLILSLLSLHNYIFSYVC